MIPIIIMIISLLLDGILSNFLPYLVNDLSYFTPLFTVTCIFIIYPFFRKQEKKYYLILFVLGIVYDLFYTNLLFFHGSIFVVLGFLSYLIQKNFGLSYLKNIWISLVIITAYEGITVAFLLLYNMVPVTFNTFVYKLNHSLLLNIIYAEIVYFIIKILPKKFRKISIN